MIGFFRRAAHEVYKLLAITIITSTAGAIIFLAIVFV
jgi:hypothetical protein